MKTGKNGPTHKPHRASANFFLLLRYNLFMGVNEMRVKVLPLLCRLGLVLQLGSVYSLTFFHYCVTSKKHVYHYKTGQLLTCIL